MDGRCDSCVGALAIAGLPPLNGFASEWLTLQALLHVSAYGGVATGIAGAIALAALATTAALAVFCFVKVAGLVLLGEPRREAVASARGGSAGRCGAPSSFSLLACVVLGVAPGLLFGALVGLAPWPATRPTALGLHLPGTGSLPTPGSRSSSSRSRPCSSLLRGTAECGASADLGVRAARRAGAALDERGVHEAAAARAGADPAPAARDRRARARAASSRR